MTIKFEDIGRRLRAYRFGKNLTARDVAERIGVSRAAVYRLERGELVKIETLEKLSIPARRLPGLAPGSWR
jgi:transcriptional regulator with XRE-family HTH domain